MAFPASAQVDPDHWYVVLPEPELLVRFPAPEGDGARPPIDCPELLANATRDQIECWAQDLQRRATRVYDDQRSEAMGLACFDSGWVVKRPAAVQSDPDDSAGCIGSAGLCVRPALKRGGLFSLGRGDVAPDVPIQQTIDRAYAQTRALAEEYTGYQYLRRGYGENRHNDKIAALAMSNGLLVLYRAQMVLHFERELRRGGCGAAFLQSYFALARSVVDEVGGNDLPLLLEAWPPPSKRWTRRLYQLELALLGSPDGVDPKGDWNALCDELSTTQDDLEGRDADLHAWCGYALARSGDDDRAEAHWWLARRSGSHPDASSWASAALRHARVEKSKDVSAARGATP